MREEQFLKPAKAKCFNTAVFWVDAGRKGSQTDLAKLNLIRIQEVDTPQQRFAALLTRLRSNETEVPALEEIAQEVETVRIERQVSNRNSK